MNTYRLSFTTGSLLINESIKVAQIYLERGNWDDTKEYVLKNNILQKKSSASQIRQFREIRHRISTLTRNELVELEKGEITSSKSLLLLAVSKVYPLIYDFIIEIVRPKWLQFDNQIIESDYDKFILIKSEIHEELAQLAEVTQAKIKQVLFRILVEGGIINSIKSKQILQPYLPENLIRLILDDSPIYLKIFLYSDKDIDIFRDKYGTA